jgi:hypothetical protein
MRIRRRRNAAILAAIAAGTTVPPTRNGKRRSDPLSYKPKLWEVHVTPGPPTTHDPEKGWAEILVRNLTYKHSIHVLSNHIRTARSGRYACSRNRPDTTRAFITARLMVTTTAALAFRQGSCRVRPSHHCPVDVFLGTACLASTTAT